MHLLTGAKLGTLHGSFHNSACVTKGLLHSCHISKVQGPTRPIPHMTQIAWVCCTYYVLISCESCMQVSYVDEALPEACELV